MYSPFSKIKFFFMSHTFLIKMKKKALKNKNNPALFTYKKQNKFKEGIPLSDPTLTL